MYRKSANSNPTGQENPVPYTPIEESTTHGTGDIEKPTNRFRTDTTYDEAGNVIVDDKFRAMGFGYDANGRMVRATKTGVPDATSVYDASGLRVAECVNDAWRFLIYDIGGKLVAEYGGLQATDEGGVKYVVQDWQGSTRAVVGNSGSVQARMDYTAYGESVGAGTGLRTSQQGFGGNDTIRQRYGLTERDDATGLDHTWFRKHENQAGRWTSPDPYNGSMNLGDPQSYNRYSYVENDPVNWIDPSGLNGAGPNTRYTNLNPMGVAYYVDGMLTDAWHAWSVIGSGAFDFIFSSIPEVSYASYGHYENDRFIRDFVILHVSWRDSRQESNANDFDGSSSATDGWRCVGGVWVRSIPKTLEAIGSFEVGKVFIGGGFLLGRRLASHGVRSGNLVQTTDGLKSAGLTGGGLITFGTGLVVHAGRTWWQNSRNSINGLRKCLN